MGDALRLIDECSREVGGCVEGGRAVILISEPRRWEPPGVGMGRAPPGRRLGPRQTHHCDCLKMSPPVKMLMLKPRNGVVTCWSWTEARLWREAENGQVFTTPFIG